MSDPAIRELFLTLWTKAVGTPKYDKRQWNVLDAYLASVQRKRTNEQRRKRDRRSS